MVETFGMYARVFCLRDACHPQAEGVAVIPGTGGGAVALMQDGFAAAVSLSPSQMTVLSGALLAAAEAALAADALATAEAAGHG